MFRLWHAGAYRPEVIVSWMLHCFFFSLPLSLKAFSQLKFRRIKLFSKFQQLLGYLFTDSCHPGRSVPSSNHSIDSGVRTSYPLVPCLLRSFKYMLYFLSEHYTLSPELPNFRCFRWCPWAWRLARLLVSVCHGTWDGKFHWIKRISHNYLSITKWYKEIWFFILDKYSPRSVSSRKTAY